MSRIDAPTFQSPPAEKLAYLRQRSISFDALPEHMLDGVADYLLFGLEPGGFLRALFSNDLKDSFGRADEINVAAMRAWVLFIYNEMPSLAQGSRERVQAWVARGGMLSINKARDAERAAEDQP